MRAFALLIALITATAAWPARADWLRAETEHFIIYGDTSERALRAYAQKVERFDNLLRAYYPRNVDHQTPKLEVFLADGMADMRRAWPDIEPSVGGWYAPNSGRIYAVVNTDSRMGDAVLFHEYGHHFMYQLASAAYPPWFIEGFAEYYATADMDADRVRVGLADPGRMNSLTQGANSWPPLEDVLRWRVSRSGRYRGADYYALSWALTHYMLSDPARTRALGGYLAAVGAGVDEVEALAVHFDRTPAQLQNDLRRYLLGAIPVLTLQIDLPTPDVEVSPMPDGADSLIWLDLRLDAISPKADVDVPEPDGEIAARINPRVLAEQRERDLAQRRLLIDQAIATGRRRPDSPWAAYVVARAERAAGRPADALAAIEPVLDASPNDARARLVAARALLDQAEAAPDEAASLVRRARLLLSAALDADPMDFRIYVALDDTRRGAPGYPSANDLSTLEVAIALAPQSFDNRMRLASAYLAVDRPHDAVRLLDSVVHSPHGGGGEAGRALMARAQAAAGQAADVEPPPPVEAAPGAPEGATDGPDAARTEPPATPDGATPAA